MNSESNFQNGLNNGDKITGGGCDFREKKSNFVEARTETESHFLIHLLEIEVKIK